MGWSIYDDWNTGNLGAHTYVGAFVEVATFTVGVGAAIYGAPVLAIGAAGVGLAYGILCHYWRGEAD